jgi:hypothetical protein
MKRLLIILFCLPLLFACQKDELFEEGQEIVLKFSVDVGNLQSATRAFAEDADRSSDLWLVLFDKSGYLVNQPIPATIGTTGDETEFSVTLPATVEERIVHFLLNPPLNNNKFELEYGHENNLIGGLIAGPNHDVYWQRVELPNILNENVLGTTPIPLVRNFAKITVDEEVDGFEIDKVYVLNKPDRGTVAPFLNGNFLDYLSYKDENTNKITYAKLNTAGYYGFMPREYDLINSSANGSNNNSVNGFFEAKNTEDGSFYDYLYESTNSANNVSVLIKSKAESNNWYRVDLVKAGTGGVLEYYDVLRNFNYHINITGVDVGHSSVADAIQQPAGNNILNSVILSNLTSVTDDQTKATLEVSYTDTVLTKTGEVKVKYRFTVGSQNKNGNIAGKSDKDGWYYTWEGQEEGKEAPISPISESSFATSDNEGWSEVTINVTKCDGRNVKLTFYAVEGNNNRVLSRTVTFYLLGEQKLKVECTPLVPLGVGQAVDVSLLIPKGLPETMFPLDFAIESQAAADEPLSYLAQYITPANIETVSVKTGGSIVEGFEGKKSFQYVVTLTYDQYDDDDVSEKVVDGITMKVFTTKFKTNTAVSASTVYAYNSYFNLGKAEFDNINLRAVFTEDNTNYYGVGRTATLEIQSDKAGTYTLSSETFDDPVETTRNVSDYNFKLEANATKKINLKTNSFGNQGKVKLNCTIDGVKFEYEVQASERNTLSVQLAASGTTTPSNTTSVTMSVANVTKYWSNWTSGQSIEINDLESNTNITFTYSTGSGWNKKNYEGITTAGALANGTVTINFKQQ